MVRTASILYLISIPVTLFTGLSGEVAIVSTGLSRATPRSEECERSCSLTWFRR